MYEFKNKQPAAGIIRGEFPVELLASFAVMRFKECPKFITIALHANRYETSSIHCCVADSSEVRHYNVPQQPLISELASNGVRYTYIAVHDVEDEVGYWLVVCELDRTGFLIPRSFAESSEI